jgi:lipid II:glycine glycyltransferase (peptidoglycan interpeptide bridge formation enzyme)
MELKNPFTGKRGVSLPFSDYCDPVGDGGVPVPSLMESISEYGEAVGWKTVEIRCRDIVLDNAVPSQVFLNHVLELRGGEVDLLSRFRDSTRRNIRKAKKEGVEVRIEDSFESIRHFYRLHCLTRKEHGLPPQPFSFFVNLHRHLISKGAGFVAIAYHEMSPVSAAVYLHAGRKGFYKYGASDKNYFHLRANNLVMWEAIRWYLKNGYASLCFGRTEVGNEGLNQFKAGWATEEGKIRYYMYDINTKAFVRRKSNVSGVHNKIFRQMPVPLLRYAGELLYRYFG